MPMHWGTQGSVTVLRPRGMRLRVPSRTDVPVPSLQSVSWMGRSKPSRQKARACSFTDSLESAYFSGSQGESDCESLHSAQDYDFGSLEKLSLPDSALLCEPEPEPEPDPQLLYDRVEELVCYHLLNLIELFLSETQIHSLRCSKLLISEPVLLEVGRELLHASASEPCGLKGALIVMFVEHGKNIHNIGQLTADPRVVPTFQLNLILRLEAGLWPKIQGLFSAPPAIAPGFGLALKLGPGFQVLKKKLYITPPLDDEC